MRFVILGAQFSKTLRGTLLAICHFGGSVFQKVKGGHCLRFVILGAQFFENLRGTLLAICHFGSSVFQKLKGDNACEASLGGGGGGGEGLNSLFKLFKLFKPSKLASPGPQDFGLKSNRKPWSLRCWVPFSLQGVKS